MTAPVSMMSVLRNSYDDPCAAIVAILSHPSKQGLGRTAGNVHALIGDAPVGTDPLGRRRDVAWFTAMCESMVKDGRLQRSSRDPRGIIYEPTEPWDVDMRGFWNRDGALQRGMPTVLDSRVCIGAYRDETGADVVRVVDFYRWQDRRAAELGIDLSGVL